MASSGEPVVWQCKSCGIERFAVNPPVNVSDDPRCYENLDDCMWVIGQGAPLADANPKTGAARHKPSLHAIPPVALLYLGQAMAEGKRKYGLTNWRKTKVAASVYFDAAMRHLLAWWDGQTNDDGAGGSGLPHLAMAMASLSILLDAAAQGVLIDDRPEVSGKAAELIELLQKMSKVE